jgi:hypothetical protein
MAKVIMKVEMVNTSRQQYKPYSYNLVPEDLHVEVDVDDDNVIINSKGKVVVTLEGFATIVGDIAESFDQMHEKYIVDARKKGKAVV